jgi:hypothetical protein
MMRSLMILFTLMLAMAADFGAMLVSSLRTNAVGFYSDVSVDMSSPCRAPEGCKIGFLSCKTCARLPWEGGEVGSGGRRTPAKVSMPCCLVSFHH